MALSSSGYQLPHACSFSLGVAASDPSSLWALGIVSPRQTELISPLQRFMQVTSIRPPALWVLASLDSDFSLSNSLTLLPFVHAPFPTTIASPPADRQFCVFLHHWYGSYHTEAQHQDQALMFVSSQNLRWNQIAFVIVLKRCIKVD